MRYIGMDKKKILIAMSGGVDSSAAAHLIISAGYEAIGGTMRLTDGLPGIVEGCDGDVAAAAATCRRLGIDHTAIDLCKEFRNEVVGDFSAVYLKGETPNPCIVCNKKIKFGALLAHALSIGCDGIATGHYAVIKKSASGRYLLNKACDASKDQSYMLWTLSQEQLSRVILPLGKMTKAEVRELAASLGFENAHKKDSQDVCFIPDGNYPHFIEKYTGVSPVPGKYLDLDGNILGKHKGMINYTVGQRKGLGIALGEPMFVHSKCAENNSVTLCKNDMLFSRTLEAHSINLIACDSISSPIRVTAKARYRHEAAPATAVQTDSDTIRVEFDLPVRAITPGQSVVLYDGDTVIGGGIIK